MRTLPTQPLVVAIAPLMVLVLEGLDLKALPYGQTFEDQDHFSKGDTKVANLSPDNNIATPARVMLGVQWWVHSLRLERRGGTPRAHGSTMRGAASRSVVARKREEYRSLLWVICHESAEVEQGQEGQGGGGRGISTSFMLLRTGGNRKERKVGVDVLMRWSHSAVVGLKTVSVITTISHDNGGDGSIRGGVKAGPTAADDEAKLACVRLACQ